MAEHVIFKSIQTEYFSSQQKLLSNGQGENCDRKLSSKSSIYRLDPYMDERGLLRADRRLSRSNMTEELVHTIILPKDSHVTSLIVSFYHINTCHSARGITLNEIRSNGYWIVGARGVITSHIWKCVKCRKYRGSTSKQKMADLPVDRLSVVESFTLSAVDFFGPFYIKAC